jgi:hypothetical protein
MTQPCNTQTRLPQRRHGVYATAGKTSIGRPDGSPGRIDAEKVTIRSYCKSAGRRIDGLAFRSKAFSAEVAAPAAGRKLMPDKGLSGNTGRIRGPAFD